MAKDIRIIFSGDHSRADASIKSLENSGKQAASILEREFNQLGIKSALSFDNQRLAAEKAYTRIKSSGLATASELERAQKAHSAAIVRIDEEQHGKRVAMLDKFKANWLGVTASIAAAWAIASKAITLAQEGAAFQSQGTSFANLAASHGKSADQIVTDLQRVSNGTMSIQQTVEQAGKAMVLGVAADYLPKLMEMARASARITGETTGKAFNDLVEGVAKGSSELLNNLGIIVRAEDAYKKYAAAHNLVASALTAEQKQQAILNEVMLKGNDIVERAGKLGESEAEKLATFAASIDNIGKSVGVLLSGPMSRLAAGMSETVNWVEAYKNGQITFWEMLSTNDAGVAEKLNGLQKTNLDATVTEEGKSLARKKIEDTARAAAEAQKKATAEALVVAATEREKQLTEIRAHNDKILAVEAKRIKMSLDQESGHLQKLVDNYGAAVAAMDSLIDARAAVRSQLDARNAADAAKNGGEIDPLNLYLDQQQALAAAEKKVDASFGMTAEAKAKAYADLIDQAASYNQAVTINGAEIVSSYQTEYNYQMQKERMQEKLKVLLDQEAAKRTATAEKFGTDMNRAQDEVNLFQQEVLNLETILDRMNNKEINIIFKANGIGDIMAAGGMVGPPNIGQSVKSFTSPTPDAGSNESGYQGFKDYGDYYTFGGSTYWNDGSEADSGTGFAFHAGTGYVPRSGLYNLARGEQVLSRNETSAARSPASGGNVVSITGGISFVLPNVTNQSSSKDLAREALPEMLRLMNGRTR